MRFFGFSDEICTAFLPNSKRGHQRNSLDRSGSTPFSFGWIEIDQILTLRFFLSCLLLCSLMPWRLLYSLVEANWLQRSMKWIPYFRQVNWFCSLDCTSTLHFIFFSRLKPFFTLHSSLPMDVAIYQLKTPTFSQSSKSRARFEYLSSNHKDFAPSTAPAHFTSFFFQN